MKYFFFMLSIFFSSASFALFCPNNFNQINIGDSIEQIKQQCGNPTAEKTYKSDVNTPQQWTYFVGSAAGNYNNQPQIQQQPTVKMTVTFNNNQVINITVNDMSLVSTGFCGTTIQVRDSQKSVESACGKPTLIQKSQQDKEIEVTELTYSGMPTVTLTFEGGKLKERK